VTEFSVIWEGLVSGALYGLIGLAYLLILQATRTYNFAVGSFVGFAGVAYATWGQTLPFGVAAGLVLLVSVALATVTDLAVTRPIQGRETGHFGVVLGLTAAFFVIIQVTRQIFSARTVLGQPAVDGAVLVAGTTFTLQSLLTVAVAVALSGAVQVWQSHGRRGRLLAAVGDNWDAAVLLCLPIGGIRYLAVGLGGAVCALAGMLLAGASPLSFHSGFGLALTGFLALVVGGAASTWGPLLGGSVIGLTETVGARVIGASIREYLLLLVILIVFRLRPHGLLAKVVRE
jgi:branched-subunit amino acid ABC-type transport system permease component